MTAVSQSFIVGVLSNYNPPKFILCIIETSLMNEAKCGRENFDLCAVSAILIANYIDIFNILDDLTFVDENVSSA